ncbi:MAG: peptidoglycan editing factor PgeF [Pseudomonadales bacterium]|nr:peptidoglycan editing factor PgeF [Pseudomonadales bacterium]MBO6566820.1 peptidoglycan editing factor PgeF [Pseudomonadales bacterium]MBO6596494.1 peptidoglycan editing factor PgeF [Pseudomonadales bacterium]MBO6658494.1 peptidoglycan editing factor PgeF [Pseudomonadales bacterium]MBO6704390.1 peptidoglycan editing factor PgeF [Pseudomonadales bacterium]
MKRIEPDWRAHENVRAFFTTRVDGVSVAPYESFNLALHVGDEPDRVKKNRQSLDLPSEPFYLNQVHSNRCVLATENSASVEADASFTRTRGQILAIMVADCLPVLFSSRQGTVVGVAHAGWRGLANGVLCETVSAMTTKEKPEDLMAWMGPAISSDCYEVGDDVREQFSSSTGFIERDNRKWQMDLYAVAREQLASLGVSVSGGNYCTYREEAQFFSYRRDGVTGRMAGFIWLS